MSIAVFDFGKTRTKLLVVDGDSSILASDAIASQWSDSGPYPHCDVEVLWNWMLTSLAAIPDRGAVSRIVCVSHGSAMALLGDNELALPILDYEFSPPQTLVTEYARVMPSYTEVLAPLMAAGLNLGVQFYWLQRTFPEAFARVRHIVGLPQYWAWRLTGRAVCDYTCIGAHSHLWDPRARHFSSLAMAQGWDRVVAPLCRAYDEVGVLRTGVAKAIGLHPSCAVLAGGHDATVVTELYRHQGLASFSMASTGTWVVLFNTHAELDLLDPARAMFTCTTPEGDPLATAMFMGGREVEILCGGTPVAIELADIEATIAEEVFAVPAFASGGFVSGSAGRIVGRAPATARGRTALGILYAALMTSMGFDLLSSSNDIIADGGLTASPSFLALLGALRPKQRVLVNRLRQGAAMGAACLAVRGTNDNLFGDVLEPAPTGAIAGIEAYAAAWRHLVQAEAA